jgi:hypothetical protein
MVSSLWIYQLKFCIYFLSSPGGTNYPVHLILANSLLTNFSKMYVSMSGKEMKGSDRDLV